VVRSLKQREKGEWGVGGRAKQSKQNCVDHSGKGGGGSGRANQGGGFKSNLLAIKRRIAPASINNSTTVD
jgi:hypothetical protein